VTVARVDGGLADDLLGEAHLASSDVAEARFPCSRFAEDDSE